MAKPMSKDKYKKKTGAQPDPQSNMDGNENFEAGLVRGRSGSNGG